MGYRRRKSHKSGFSSYCKAQLSRVKRASKAGSRSKSVKAYQKCLNSKGIRTGLKNKEKK